MKDWKNVDENEMVCWCKGVNKGVIVDAIENGARSLSDVQKKTGAATGKECAIKNPSGNCCAEDVLEILRIYSKDADLSECTGCCNLGSFID